MSPVASTSERLSVLHVSPHPWGAWHEVNEFAGNVGRELAARGHRVLLAAPGLARRDVISAKAAVRAAAEHPQALFEGDGLPRAGDGGPPVVAVGQGIRLPRGPGPGPVSLSLDASRTLEALLTNLKLDIVHVHDPFAPGVSSAALRHSRTLNVASFHDPAERVLSTQVARPLVEIFFGRLDARTVASRRTAELVERYFPGSYELMPPGAGGVDGWWPGSRPAGKESGESERPVRIAFCALEERGALRLFLRALRRVSAEPSWEAVIWLPDGLAQPRLSAALRERVRIAGPGDCEPASLVAAADVACVASGGPRLAPWLVREALAAGTVPIASRLETYQELVADGLWGLLFPPGDALTLAGQLERAVSDVELRDGLRRAAAGRLSGWAETAERLEETYRRLCARRHDPRGDPEVRRRISRRPLIEVDLHMHTDHSPDCATPVDVLLETAKARGLGAIAITDHNEISGAVEARRLAEGIDGLQVIVAEEVKTAEQGEVIGLFLEEKIPRGLTMAETVAEIHRQGGIVYVPHPFDRFHSVPDYEHLLDIVEEIDILEVFNPRVAFSAFNEEAERFAAKYRIVPGAGSDSHVAQGLGSVRIRLHEFEGPDEFLEAMRDADIIRKQKNLVYVQALKLMQTGGGRGGRRRPSGSVRRRRTSRPGRRAAGGKN